MFEGLSIWEEETYREYWEMVSVDMDEADAAVALQSLCDYLYRYYHIKVIILLDEYDTPLQEAYASRFYHGFVLGLMVDLSDKYHVISNRESGFGYYGIMLKPTDQTQDAIIIEFKVHKPKREASLEEIVQAALQQIEEKQYDAELLAEGFSPEQIRHYGFAFRRKEVLIG